MDNPVQVAFSNFIEVLAEQYPKGEGLPQYSAVSVMFNLGSIAQVLQLDVNEVNSWLNGRADQAPI